MLKLFTVFVALLAVGSYFYLKSFRAKLLAPEDLNKQYDYIIVGGGSAGCVLASRLSENPKISVLLVEAGGEEDQPYFTHIPGAVPLLQQTEVDWEFLTVPQTKCCDGLKDKRSSWPRGKLLGGTSILNYMHYVRGDKKDYDNWAEMGNVGWSYEEMLPYFRKSEKTMIPRLQTSPFHGTEGKVEITEGYRSKLGDAFMEAVAYLGLPIIDDYNGAQHEGFGKMQFTISQGVRQSTAITFLRPVMHRTNLHVLTKAHVFKILIEVDSNNQKRAIGIRYYHNSIEYKAFASKEVALSAGAIGSPHILMLSGIGPEDQLKKFSIDVVQRLPAVGQNLLDHYGPIFRYSTNESISLDLTPATTFSGIVKHTILYYLNGSGLMAESPFEYTGFLKSTVAGTQVPELQIYISPDLFIDDQLAKNVNFAPDVGGAFRSSERSRFPYLFLVLLLHPRSKGQITLQSADPFAPPKIDPMYFHDEKDVEILVEGAKIIDAITKTPQLQKYDSKHFLPPIKACSQFNQNSEEYLRCYIRSASVTIYHPVSTCRMGTSVEDSVVDAQLRVHGIKGLRIADASVFADQISGNTYATVMMVAEKAADMIKQANTS